MKIRLIRFKRVKSTNDIAIKLIKKKRLKHAIITSENQINGRGTMGKKWISKKGNLFLSIFFEINQKKINYKQFAILNALILKKIISKIVYKKIKIKWPNDLMYDKKKICGILQEVINFKQKNFLIVGVGLNTNVDPKNKNFSSTTLKNIVNKRVSNNKILVNIKNGYEKLLNEIKKISFLELKKKYK